jgi:ABC-type branched-subunit amino acid transport system substrate-binding protein
MTIPSGHALLTALLAAASLLNMKAAPAQDILVGQVLDQSGSARELSRDYFAGAKVYFDYTNSRGGINGRKIALKTRNNEGSSEKASQLTTELIDKDKVDVLFGYVGDSNVKAAATSPSFVKSGIALVGAVSGIAADGYVGTNVYFTRASYAAEATRIVEHFRGTGMSSFAIVFAPDGPGMAFRTAMVETLKKNGLTPKSETPLSADSRAVDSVARTVYASKPQVIVMLTDALPSATFVKAYRELDQGAVIAGTSLVNSRALIELAGPGAAHGVVLTQVVPNPEKFDQLVLLEHARLLKQFLDEPPTHATLEGFIAAKVLVIALRNAGRMPKRADINKAVKALRRADLGGLSVDFAESDNRGFGFVDVTFLRRDGRVLH